MCTSSANSLVHVDLAALEGLDGPATNLSLVLYHYSLGGMAAKGGLRRSPVVISVDSNSLASLGLPGSSSSSNSRS